MRPDDGPSPDRRTAGQWLDRIRTAIRTASLPVKVLLVLALLAAVVLAAQLPAQAGDLILVLALCYGPVAVWRRQRSVLASLAPGRRGRNTSRSRPGARRQPGTGLAGEPR